MEKSMKSATVFFALAACLLATAAPAQEYKLGSLEIEHPWSRATAKGAKIGAGYLTIKNTGSAPDRLVGGSFADAAKVEIHEMSMDQGVMKMRPLSGGLEIKPGETVEFKPDGYHLMFVGLKQPLKQGERVDGTLQFEHAGSVQVQYVVGAIGQKTSSGKASMPAMAPDGKGKPAMPNMR
jgi:periplasmic copper chaperone A